MEENHKRIWNPANQEGLTECFAFVGSCFQIHPPFPDWLAASRPCSRGKPARVTRRVCYSCERLEDSWRDESLFGNNRAPHKIDAPLHE